MNSLYLVFLLGHLSSFFRLLFPVLLVLALLYSFFYDGEKKKHNKVLVILTIALTISVLLGFFLPSTRELCVLYVQHCWEEQGFIDHEVVSAINNLK